MDQSVTEVLREFLSWIVGLEILTPPMEAAMASVPRGLFISALLPRWGLGEPTEVIGCASVITHGHYLDIATAIGAFDCGQETHIGRHHASNSVGHLPLHPTTRYRWGYWKWNLGNN